jgi:DNA-binding response OmpR family regulator
MRILVVEDDLQIAAFIAEGFTQAGFAVDASGNGEEGFHMALTTPYDAAVIDLMLPAMDGLQLIDHPEATWRQEPSADSERQALC